MIKDILEYVNLHFQNFVKTNNNNPNEEGDPFEIDDYLNLHRLSTIR
jgi:hypothetical protein